MKLIYAGTPEFAARALEALLAAGHEVALVLTQPDRPAGRGMALQASPVKQLAESRGLPVFQPTTLKDPLAQARLAEVGAAVMVVAAYGLLLPQAVLDLPQFGCLNIHASLLPRWRGAAPIHRAIEAGDPETGVCIMQMEAGLDTGPVLMQAATAITSTDTTASLHDRLAEIGAQLIVQAVAQLPLAAVPQPEAGVTYAKKIDKAESAIDWRASAQAIHCRVRAFNPFPGAQGVVNGLGLKIWQATPVEGCGQPGEILAVAKDGVVVACGDGALRLEEVQKAGGKRLPIAQFLAGNNLQVGQRFDLPG